MPQIDLENKIYAHINPRMIHTQKDMNLMRS